MKYVLPGFLLALPFLSAVKVPYITFADMPFYTDMLCWFVGWLAFSALRGSDG